MGNGLAVELALLVPGVAPGADGNDRLLHPGDRD